MVILTANGILQFPMLTLQSMTTVWSISLSDVDMCRSEWVVGYLSWSNGIKIQYLHKHHVGKTTKGIVGVNKLTKRQILRMRGHYGAAIRNNVVCLFSTTYSRPRKSCLLCLSLQGTWTHATIRLQNRATNRLTIWYKTGCQKSFAFVATSANSPWQY